MTACPVDAISVDRRTGAKVVSDDLCVGCKVCTIACPFGTVNYNHDTGKVIKCDLCGGAPACAEACPTGAIAYVDADWTGTTRCAAGPPDRFRRRPGACVRGRAIMGWTRKVLRVNLTRERA